MNVRSALLLAILAVMTIFGCSNHNSEVEAANARAEAAEAETARVKAQAEVEVANRKKEGAEDVLMVLEASNDPKYIDKPTLYYGEAQVVEQEADGSWRVMFWHPSLASPNSLINVPGPSVVAIFPNNNQMLQIKEGDMIRFTGTATLRSKPKNETKHFIIIINDCILM